MTRTTILLVMLIAACEAQVAVPGTDDASECPSFPRWTYDVSHEWPADRSLLRPEDGDALPDGRLVVADEEFGLRLLAADGTHRPFGKFSENGYEHNPPDFPGGATGVFVEADGKHVLVGDIYTGRIYRVNVETEATSVVYDHPYGINVIDQDSRGRLWFTQSTMNTPEQGVGGLFGDLNLPVSTGAVYTLDPEGGAFAPTAEQVIGDMYFANGLAIDNSETYVYVAELMMDRVLRYRLDIESGSVSDREVYQTVLTPDNIEIDVEDNLWIASPIANEVVVVDAKCQSAHTVFRAPSETNASIAEQWTTRSHLGEPRLELISPEAFAPLPGFLTGLFWSADGSTVYFTGLGGSILKYPTL